MPLRPGVLPLPAIVAYSHPSADTTRAPLPCFRPATGTMTSTICSAHAKASAACIACLCATQVGMAVGAITTDQGCKHLPDRTQLQAHFVPGNTHEMRTAAAHTLMSAPLKMGALLRLRPQCKHVRSASTAMGRVQLSWLTENRESLRHSLCATAGFGTCWSMEPVSKKPCCTQTSMHEYC